MADQPEILGFTVVTDTATGQADLRAFAGAAEQATPKLAALAGQTTAAGAAADALAPRITLTSVAIKREGDEAASAGPRVAAALEQEARALAPEEWTRVADAMLRHVEALSAVPGAAAAASAGEGALSAAAAAGAPAVEQMAAGLGAARTALGELAAGGAATVAGQVGELGREVAAVPVDPVERLRASFDEARAGVDALAARAAAARADMEAGPIRITVDTATGVANIERLPDAAGDAATQIGESGGVIEATFGRADVAALRSGEAFRDLADAGVRPVAIEVDALIERAARLAAAQAEGVAVVGGYEAAWARLRAEMARAQAQGAAAPELLAPPEVPRIVLSESMAAAQAALAAGAGQVTAALAEETATLPKTEAAWDALANVGFRANEQMRESVSALMATGAAGGDAAKQFSATTEVITTLEERYASLTRQIKDVPTEPIEIRVDTETGGVSVQRLADAVADASGRMAASVETASTQITESGGTINATFSAADVAAMRSEDQYRSLVAMGVVPAAVEIRRLAEEFSTLAKAQADGIITVEQYEAKLKDLRAQTANVQAGRPARAAVPAAATPESGNRVFAEVLGEASMLPGVAGQAAQGMRSIVAAAGPAAAAVAGVVVAYELLKTAVESVKEMLELANAEQDAYNRLGFAVESVGRSWDSVSESMELYFKNLQATTRYTETQGVEALSKLIFITGDYGRATAALGPIADFAAASHTDLETAARVVGVALEGNIQLLRRYGVVFSEVEKEQLKYATRTEAAALVTEKLGEKFRGFAERDAQTVGGQIALLGNAWHSLKTTLGEDIQDGLQRSGIISTLRTFISETDAAIRKRQELDALVRKFEISAPKVVAAAPSEESGAPFGEPGFAGILNRQKVVEDRLTALKTFAATAAGEIASANNVAELQLGLLRRRREEIQALEKSGAIAPGEAAARLAPIEQQIKIRTIVDEQSQAAAEKVEEEFLARLMKKRDEILAKPQTAATKLELAPIEQQINVVVNRASEQAALGGIEDLRKRITEKQAVIADIGVPTTKPMEDVLQKQKAQLLVLKEEFVEALKKVGQTTIDAEITKERATIERLTASLDVEGTAVAGVNEEIRKHTARVKELEGAASGLELEAMGYKLAKTEVDRLTDALAKLRAMRATPGAPPPVGGFAAEIAKLEKEKRAIQPDASLAAAVGATSYANAVADAAAKHDYYAAAVRHGGDAAVYAAAEERKAAEELRNLRTPERAVLIGAGFRFDADELKRLKAERDAILSPAGEEALGGPARQVEALQANDAAVARLTARYEQARVLGVEPTSVALADLTAWITLAETHGDEWGLTVTELDRLLLGLHERVDDLADPLARLAAEFKLLTPGQQLRAAMDDVRGLADAVRAGAITVEDYVDRWNRAAEAAARAGRASLAAFLAANPPEAAAVAAPGARVSPAPTVEGVAPRIEGPSEQAAAQQQALASVHEAYQRLGQDAAGLGALLGANAADLAAVGSASDAAAAAIGGAAAQVEALDRAGLQVEPALQDEIQKTLALSGGMIDLAASSDPVATGKRMLVDLSRLHAAAVEVENTALARQIETMQKLIEKQLEVARAREILAATASKFEDATAKGLLNFADALLNIKQVEDGLRAQRAAAHEEFIADIDAAYAAEDARVAAIERERDAEIAAGRDVADAKSQAAAAVAAAHAQSEARRASVTGAYAEGNKKIARDEAYSRALAYEQAAGMAIAALQAAWPKSKALAVAAAIINTAEGVTASLKVGGVYGTIIAAVIAAAGAVQISKIMSTEPGGAGGGGGGGGGSAGAATGSQPSSGQTNYVYSPAAEGALVGGALDLTRPISPGVESGTVDAAFDTTAAPVFGFAAVGATFSAPGPSRPYLLEAGEVMLAPSATAAYLARGRGDLMVGLLSAHQTGVSPLGGAPTATVPPMPADGAPAAWLAAPNTGAAIVGGSGSGDRYPAMLAPGAAVLPRWAVAALSAPPGGAAGVPRGTLGAGRRSTSLPGLETGGVTGYGTARVVESVAASPVSEPVRTPSGAATSTIIERHLNVDFRFHAATWDGRGAVEIFKGPDVRRAVVNMFDEISRDGF